MANGMIMVVCWSFDIEKMKSRIEEEKKIVALIGEQAEAHAH